MFSTSYSRRGAAFVMPRRGATWSSVERARPARRRGGDARRRRRARRPGRRDAAADRAQWRARRRRLLRLGCADRAAGARRAAALGAKHDTAALYVHAINPFGFSHLRRVTQENVDLNRNCIDFDVPLPVNAGYAEIHDLLLPATWPPALGRPTRRWRPTPRASAPRAAARNLARPVRLCGRDVLRRPRADLEQPRASRDSSPTTVASAARSRPSTSTPAWGPTATANASSRASTMPASCRAQPLVG